MIFKNENSLTSIKDRWSKPPNFIIRNIDDIILCIGFFLKKRNTLYWFLPKGMMCSSPLLNVYVGKSWSYIKHIVDDGP